MTELENAQEPKLSDRISVDDDEDAIEFEPTRLNLEARAVEL
jgi:hypothetical protein